MRRVRNLKSLALALLLTTLATALYAQSASFESVSGKVEIRRAGGSWEPARVGMAIDRDTTISTGFAASATLTLGDSTLEVEQLTRMTLVNLVESSDQVDTEVFLNVGRVNANVRTAERRQTFEVRGALSTASVRGTRFRFDGQRLQVFEGSVALESNTGQSRNIGAGRQSAVSSDGSAPSDPQDEIVGATSTDIAPVGLGGDDDDDSPGFGPQSARNTRGGVSVELTFPE
ncbi:MAG: FecR family protein [Alkalispirochaetaceae bacterium]